MSPFASYRYERLVQPRHQQSFTLSRLYGHRDHLAMLDSARMDHQAPERAGGLSEDGGRVRTPRPDSFVCRDSKELEPGIRVNGHGCTIPCPALARKSATPGDMAIGVI